MYLWQMPIYKVTIEESSESIVQANLSFVRPQPTPFDTETTITAESILGDIRTQLILETILIIMDLLVHKLVQDYM